MTTILEIIDGGTRYLEKRGIDDARTNMQLLVAAHLGCTRTQLYMDFDKPLTEADIVPLREWLKKRGEGIPLQHLVGSVEFHGRTFLCDSRALIPRPETEELLDFVIDALGDLPPAKFLDVGTGSGVIGLTLAAAFPEAEVICSDISTEALELARENANALELKNVTFAKANGIPKGEPTFDAIVSNPPYIADSFRAEASKEVQHDPEMALYSGADGLDLIRHLIPAAFTRLKSGGLFALEIGHDQAAAVSYLLQQAGFTDIKVEPDLSGILRFPLARKP